MCNRNHSSGLQVVQMGYRWCRWFTGGADASSVEPIRHFLVPVLWTPPAAPPPRSKMWKFRKNLEKSGETGGGVLGAPNNSFWTPLSKLGTPKYFAKQRGPLGTTLSLQETLKGPLIYFSRVLIVFEFCLVIYGRSNTRCAIGTIKVAKGIAKF